MSLGQTLPLEISDNLTLIGKDKRRGVPGHVHVLRDVIYTILLWSDRPW